MKEKSCKKCDKKRYANFALCYKHYRSREKEKRKEREKRKLERKKRTKKYQMQAIKTLKNKCWKLMSELVRRRDTDYFGNVSCFTCGKRDHWKNMHAGHFQHGKLDFDDRNIKPQCVSCNRYNGGRLDEYSLKLAEKHGTDWVRRLKNDASRHAGYSYDELVEIEADLKKQLKSL